MKLFLPIIVFAFSFSVLAQEQKKVVVEAQSGDTVTTLSRRNSVDPTETAKLNGLLPDSILGKGREIFILLPSCVMKVDAAPEVRGLKLGMSRTAYLDMIRPQMRDIAMISTVPSAFVDSKKFEGVMMISTEFFDDKLLSFSLTYSSDADWKSDREFSDAIAEKLSLPKLGWDQELGGGRTLSCGGFSVKTTAWPNMLTMTDTGSADAKAQADKIAAEKKKAAFKP